MTGFLSRKVNHYNWTALVYLFLIMFFWKTVDWRDVNERRQKSLLRTFANGNLKDYRDGIVYLDDYLRDHPQDVDSLGAIGICYEQLGDLAQARAYYRKAYELDPHEELFQQRLQAVAYRLKNPLPNESFR